MSLADDPVTAVGVHGQNGLARAVNYEAQYKEQAKRIEKERLDAKYSEESGDVLRSTIHESEMTKEKAEEEIDMKFKNFLRDNIYHKSIAPSVNLGSGTAGKYLNHYVHRTSIFEDYIDKHDGDITGSILRKYETDINRCFFADTLEKIKENLRNENTRFAKYCLEKFEEQDPIALNVTLSLLRKAIKTSYSE